MFKEWLRSGQRLHKDSFCMIEMCTGYRL
ncbi:MULTISPECIES: DUF1543 domain-containing protein [Paenibacillus]